MTFGPKQPERVLFWIASASALVALVALLRPPAETLLWKALFDAGHAVVSGYLGLVFLRLIQAWTGGYPPLRASLWAFVITMACGLGIEIVQIVLPRDANLGDLMRNGLGAAGMLSAEWACARDAGGRLVRQRWVRNGLLGGAIVLYLIAFAPVGAIVWAYTQRDAAFPRLCDFDARWETYFVEMWKADLERTPRPAGWGSGQAQDKAGLVTFRGGDYPRYVLKEPVRDWSHHRELVFEVFSQLGTPVEIVLRIDDAVHNQEYDDRFNRPLMVSPGANLFRVPLADVRRTPRGREMDLTHIARIVIFTVEPPQPLSLFFDALRLE